MEKISPRIFGDLDRSLFWTFKMASCRVPTSLFTIHQEFIIEPSLCHIGISIFYCLNDEENYIDS